MEEENIKDGAQGKKLTYEQLEAYAQQTIMQAQKIYEENKALHQALQHERLNNNYKEIELALKCLDHKELFSEKFITAVIERLEEVLYPIKPEAKEDKEEESKED